MWGPPADPEVRPTIPDPEHGSLWRGAFDRSVRSANAAGRLGRIRHRAGQDHRVGHQFHFRADHEEPTAMSLSKGSSLYRRSRGRSKRSEQLYVRVAVVAKTIKVSESRRGFTRGHLPR